MGIASVERIFKQAKPFLGVIFMQFGYAGNSIIAKNALNNGMDQHVLVVYRYAIATLFISPFALVLDRKIRPKMTLSVFIKILLLALLEPTLYQNLYYTGMKYTTATFAIAMCNILPAVAFLMAWICRLENVSLRKIHSLLKILGTIVTVGGAMLMTLVTGPMLPLPWTQVHNAQQGALSSAITKQDPIKGAMFMGIGCLCWSSFIILQAITLKSYPATLSLTAWICCMGAIEGTVFALAIEKGSIAGWFIFHSYSKLVAPLYSGIISSAVAYYIQGVVMRTKGPVFVTAFNPLSMVIVAILSSFVLSEILYLGRVIGAIVIVVGLYLFLWGKSKDQSSTNREATADPGDKEMTALDELNQDAVVMDVTSRVTSDHKPV
ncbi:hypothetical protein SLE2022_070040 [Rubroshorea leprosula]